MEKFYLHCLILAFSFASWSCSSDNGIQGIIESDNPNNELEESDIPDSNTLGILLNNNRSYDGYTLFTIYKNTYLIDNCGRVVNEWVSEYDRGGAFYLLEDGSLLRAGKIENPDLPYGGVGGIIEKFDWEGNLTWEFKYTSPSYSQHHGLYPLPNGNILLLAVQRQTKDQAILAGRNPEKLSEEMLYNERIIEVAPLGSNGGSIIWEWSVWDHLIQDFDSSKNNFGAIAEQPGLLDINFLGNSNGEADWLHINSLNYNEDLDQIILSSQKLSEIYIIDHSTTTTEAATGLGGNNGNGGDFLYRWGNPETYGHGSQQDRQLFGQHNVHWIPNGNSDEGKILIFNNGLGRDLNYSSIDIINPPMNTLNNYSYTQGQSYGPHSPEWSYTNPEDSELFYSRILSSAQRLPNGNTLICEGTQGKFFEIDINGLIVWKYLNPISSKGIILKQGDIPSSNVFQIIRYGPNYKGFIGKDLEPGNPLERDFDIGNCN